MEKTFVHVVWEELDDFNGLGVRRSRDRGDDDVSEALPLTINFCPTGSTDICIVKDGKARGYVGEISFTIHTPFMCKNKKDVWHVFMDGGKVEKYSPKKHATVINDEMRAALKLYSIRRDDLCSILNKKKARAFVVDGKTIIVVEDKAVAIGCNDGYNILLAEKVIDEKGWVLNTKLPARFLDLYLTAVEKVMKVL